VRVLRASAAQAFRVQNGEHLLVCALQVVVHEHIVIAGPALDLIARIGEPLGDGLGRIFRSPLQPRAQLLHGGRQDEDRHHIVRRLAAHLLGALVVDVEEHIAALSQHRLYGHAG
jgi:hypothetical protein